MLNRNSNLNDVESLECTIVFKDYCRLNNDRIISQMLIFVIATLFWNFKRSINHILILFLQLIIVKMIVIKSNSLFGVNILIVHCFWINTKIHLKIQYLYTSSKENFSGKNVANNYVLSAKAEAYHK